MRIRLNAEICAVNTMCIYNYDQSSSEQILSVAWPRFAPALTVQKDSHSQFDT